jgi:hypothetical protein
MSFLTLKRIKIVVAFMTVMVMLGPGTFITIPAGTSFRFGAASAETLFTLSGKVLLPNGNPAANCPVGIHTADYTQSYWRGANQNGEYSIENIVPGTYLLEANPPYGTPGLTSADPISIIISGSITNQNISLKSATKTISGIVTRSDGTPVYRAQINVFKYDSNGGAGTETDSSGAYSMSIAGGHYGVNIQPSNAPDAPTPDWIYDGPTQELNFASDETAQSATLNFTVTSAKAIIVATVVDTNGAPITSGHVDVRTADGKGNGKPLDNSNVVTLRVPAGGYFVNYFSQDNRYSAPAVSINVVDYETKYVTLTAKEKTAHITGTVADVNGVGLPNIRLNINCNPLGSQNNIGGSNEPGSNSNGTSSANGSFDILTTAGYCHVNVDQNSSSNYIYNGTPIDVSVPTETSTVSVGTLNLVFADAKITGRILDESGNPVGQLNGSVYARKIETTTGTQSIEYNAPINNGRYEIKVPSSVFSIVQLGVHFPPNINFSIKDNPTVTVVANSTTVQDLSLVRNTSAIYGSVVTSSGIPLTSCNPVGNAKYFGEIFVNNSEKGFGSNTMIRPDCSFEISVGAGTYQFGYHIDERAGYMNRQVSSDPIVIANNQRIAKNITVTAADATIKVTIVDPKGNPVPRVWVNADNHEEINGGPNGQGTPGDIKGMEDQKGPGGFTNPKDIMKYCTDAKHKAECEKDKMPPGTKGPGGCSNAWQCSQFCSKAANKDECGKFINQQTGTKNNQNQPQTGPGGCKTETECKAYCSKPANTQECSKFAPATGQLTGAAYLPVQVKGATTEDNVGNKQENYDKQINSGGQTDENGMATIPMLSGHKYQINTGLPPDSPYMPAPMQSCDLTKSTSCSLVLTLQQSDASVTGQVFIGKTPVSNQCYVHSWSESGGYSGTPVNNGSFKLNISSGSTWHIGADCPQGRDFYRSEEIVLVADKAGSYKQNLTVTKNIVQLPDPVSMTFEGSEQAVLTLADGTTVTMPAGSIATSGSVTVTATPTVQINSQQNNQPAFGFGYEFKAIQNGATITSFAASTVSIQFKYNADILTKLGISEDLLVPKYYDATQGSWKQPDNITQDKINDTITVSQLGHFSVHSLVSTAGTSAGKTNLTSVTTSKNKKGQTQITVGSGKSFIPFSNYTGTVTVKTANLGGSNGQVVVVAPSGKTKDAAKVITYKVTGNKKTSSNVTKSKELVPFTNYKNGVNLSLADITKDGKEDIIVSTVNGSGEVRIYNIAKQLLDFWALDAGKAAFKGNAVISVLEAYTKGQGTLVIKAGNDLEVYKYDSKKSTFSKDTKFNIAAKFSITGDTVSLKELSPKITNAVSTAYSSDTNKTVKVTLKGVYLTNKTTVLLNNKALSVKYKNSTTLEVTIKPSLYKKGSSYRFQVSNSEGTTTSGKITFK